MSSRGFDFETAIWDCRSTALMNSHRSQADIASNERILAGRIQEDGHAPSDAVRPR